MNCLLHNRASVHGFFCVSNNQISHSYERTSWEYILKREDVYILDNLSELELLKNKK